MSCPPPQDGIDGMLGIEGIPGMDGIQLVMSFADCAQVSGIAPPSSHCIFSNSSLVGACVSFVCITIFSNAFFWAGVDFQLGKSPTILLTPCEAICPRSQNGPCIDPYTEPIPPPRRPVTVETVPPTSAPVNLPIVTPG